TLGGTLTGNGTLTLDGGMLKSQFTNSFTGEIDVHAGTITVDKVTDPLGTGTLLVAVTAGKTASLNGSTKAGAILDNPLVLTGGTLQTTGFLEFDGAVTVNAGILGTQGVLMFTGAVNLRGGTVGSRTTVGKKVVQTVALFGTNPVIIENTVGLGG